MKHLIILILINLNILSNELNDKYSLLVKENKENNVYFNYVKDLITEKKMSKEQIKEILNSKERTVKSNMLKALNYDFNLNKPDKAIVFYEEILKKVSNKIKNTTEAIYISDYLIRTNKYDIIEKILTIEYCESLLDNEKEGKCLYYLYFTKKENIFNKEEIYLKNKYKKLWESLQK